MARKGDTGRRQPVGPRGRGGGGGGGGGGSHWAEEQNKQEKEWLNWRVERERDYHAGAASGTTPSGHGVGDRVRVGGGTHWRRRSRRPSSPPPVGGTWGLGGGVRVGAWVAIGQRAQAPKPNHSRRTAEPASDQIRPTAPVRMPPSRGGVGCMCAGGGRGAHRGMVRRPWGARPTGARGG